jgi:hypothetical protein
MMPPPRRAIADLVQELERRLRHPPIAGMLDREAVEALDVVNHALAFVRHARALELWREALWTRRLAGETRQAVVQMLEYLADALAQGRGEEVSRICDCLHAVVRVGSLHHEA